MVPIGRGYKQELINMYLETKKEIRKLILGRRDAVDPKLREQWDNSVFDRLVHSEYYKKARVIFAFVSFRSEVDTHRIINRALADNKIICVPRIKSKDTGIELYRINSMNDLEKGYFGILEPSEHCQAVDCRDIELILMPGAAFDRNGSRLGYGRGYYDRFLEGMDNRVQKLALAYHFQVLDRVPTDELDIPVDAIITDEECIIVKKLT